MTKQRIRIGVGPGEFITFCKYDDAGQACTGPQVDGNPEGCSMYFRCWDDLELDDTGHFMSEVVTMKAGSKQ